MVDKSMPCPMKQWFTEDFACNRVNVNCANWSYRIKIDHGDEFACVADASSLFYDTPGSF